VADRLVTNIRGIAASTENNKLNMKFPGINITNRAVGFELTIRANKSILEGGGYHIGETTQNSLGVRKQTPSIEIFRIRCSKSKT
jgi:hypothetical protein